MNSAVVFGAGSIGRGFLGQLFFEGGYRTTFIDADELLVERLNARKEYPLRLVTPNETHALTIGNVNAINAAREDMVIAAVVDTDVICTAVGIGVLPRIAAVLAGGISERDRLNRPPFDLFLCENQWHVADSLRERLTPHLAPDARQYFDDHVGLVETVVGRMVPKPTEALLTEDPLLMIAEPYNKWPAEKNALRAAAPTLPGLILAEGFEAYEARKLYLHNMGHAALAYLGALRNHQLIWQCVEDSEIAAVCTAAMAEVSEALVHEYAFDHTALQDFTDDLMRRFTNRALGDTVARVAADPLRKLRPDDRLIGAASLCLKHEIRPMALARVITAAIHYAEQEGKTATDILENVCSLAPNSPLAEMLFGPPPPILGEFRFLPLVGGGG